MEKSARPPSYLQKNFITEEGLKNSTAKLFPENTVLIALYGATAGQVSVLGFEAATNQAICGILPHEHLEPRFLYYTLLCQYDSIVAQAVGNAQPNLSQIKIKNLIIPVPPLPEQRRIVAILDEAFEGIAAAKANTKKNLENAREVFESYLNRVFGEKGDGYTVQRLDDIATIKSGKRVPKGYKFETEITDHPYIRVSDFTDEGTVVTDKIKYLSKDVFESISRYIITDEDVYVTIVGATVGKSGIIPRSLNGANLTENACRLVLNPEVDKNFIYYFTQSDWFKEQVGINTRVSAQPKLALTRLKGILVSVPTLDMQRELVNRCDQHKILFQQTGAVSPKKNHCPR